MCHPAEFNGVHVASSPPVSDTVINFLFQHTDTLLHWALSDFPHFVPTHRDPRRNVLRLSERKTTILTQPHKKVAKFQGCVIGRRYHQGFHWDKGIKKFYTSGSRFFGNETSNNGLLPLSTRDTQWNIKNKQKNPFPQSESSHIILNTRI